MKHFICALFLLMATTALADEPLIGLRSDALNLLRILQTTQVVNSHPEEFRSFAATISAAEELYNNGESAAAAQRFTLAIMKGEILLSQRDEPPVPATPGFSQPPRPGFAQMSSAALEKPVQPLQTAVVPPTADNGAEALEPSLESKISEHIVGGQGIYTVARKESLKLVASRLGVRLRDLAKMNRLSRDATVIPGQRLKYNNRRIIPKTIKNGIIVNIPERSLYLFRNGKVSASYPVAVGISKKKESTIWRTPVGKFQIVDKKENPTWRIPPSIQKEMEEKGEEVLEFIPPGPKNPLGKYAMRTTLAGILIHSTTRPTSINSYSSHGCIRVMPEHMERLFKAVSVPMQGEIIYQPIKVEVTTKGRVFLEVNNDSYEQVEDISAEVRKAISKHRAESRVSWQMVNKVTIEKSGIAEDVTLPEMPD